MSMINSGLVTKPREKATRIGDLVLLDETKGVQDYMRWSNNRTSMVITDLNTPRAGRCVRAFFRVVHKPTSDHPYYYAQQLERHGNQVRIKPDGATVVFHEPVKRHTGFKPRNAVA